METTESKPHRASPTRFVAHAGRDGAGAGRAQIQIQAVAVGEQLAWALGRRQRPQWRAGTAHPHGARTKDGFGSDPDVTFYHILIRIRIRMRISSDTNTKRIVRIRIRIRIFET